MDPPEYDVRSGSLSAAMAGAHRSEKNRARDISRHPEETLSFFGIQPEMTVVEVWPGGGWYTEILAPYLRDEGKLVAATQDPEDSSFRGRFAREFRASLARSPEIYDQVELSVLYTPAHLEPQPEASVDMVVSFRSAHNWVRWPGNSPEAYFQAIARMLKPGGVLGIVQHRAPEGTAEATSGTIGYLTEEFVIGLARQAGLELAGRSEINANARDNHAHPGGVWWLPPVMRGKGASPAERQAVGESDRMTLRFQKPTN